MSELDASIIGHLSGGQRRTAVELVAGLGVVRVILEPRLAHLAAKEIISSDVCDGDVLYSLA